MRKVNLETITDAQSWYKIQPLNGFNPDNLTSQNTQLAIDISHELITISSLLDSSRQHSSRPSQPFQWTPLGGHVCSSSSQKPECLDFWNLNVLLLDLQLCGLDRLFHDVGL